MKTLIPSLLVVLALTACDRREQQPVEPSTTADTASASAPATTPAGDQSTAPTDAMAQPPGANNTTGACAGLTGAAQEACLKTTGPNGPAAPGSTPPPVNTPTPSTPPPGTTEAPPPTDAGAPPKP